MPRISRKRCTVGTRQLAAATNALQTRQTSPVICDICCEEKPMRDMSARRGCPEQCKTNHSLCKVCESTMRSKVKQTGGYLQCPWCRTPRGPLFPTPSAIENNTTTVEILYQSSQHNARHALTPVEAVMLLSADSFLHSHATRVTLERRFQEIIALASVRPNQTSGAS